MSDRERRRIIIDNRSSSCTDAALDMVGRVMREGRISNGGYCYATVFTKSRTCVYATKNKTSDTFIIIDDPRARKDKTNERQKEQEQG